MEANVPLDVKRFIDKEVIQSARVQMVPLIQRAYELVDASLKETSFLNWDLGFKHRGYLDNIAAQFTLYEAANKGLLKNIHAEMIPNKSGSAYHVELKTNNITITINRTSNKYVTARKAHHRSILQINNQFYWDFGEHQVQEEPGYLQLTHNHVNRKVDFVNLGVPNGRGRWFSRIDLTKELHIISSPQVQQEANNISKEQLVKFKKFAQEVQENGGNN